MLIGIDLGTTNSSAACFIDGRVQIIPNRLGRKLTPSIVSIDDSDHVMVGETAREYGILHPERTASVFKRAMGTAKIYDLGDHSFSPEELSSFVLRSLREDAETYLKEPVREAIISVPAYFNDRQRKATVRAGELAGLKVTRIINEPTASAIAYGMGEQGKSERCLVLDLGGGTFDVTVLEYYRNIMEVYAIAGDNHLGGEDFTQVLYEMFMERTGLDQDLLSFRDLKYIYKAAEICKCSFCQSDVALMNVTIGDKRYAESFQLSDYEHRCQPLLERLRKPIEKALNDARITFDDLDEILLTGGAVRLPIIGVYVDRICGIKTVTIDEPETSVVIGAALQCAMKERDAQIEEVILTDVCPFTLGTEVIKDNGSFEIPGVYLPIIERNTVIPVSRKQTVYTARDNQQFVTVKILQGESRIAANNLSLGELTVEVPIGPKGQEAIEVTYTYDIDALLEVQVKVLSTGTEKKVVIQDEKHEESESEKISRMKRLEYLKFNPREDEDNMLVLLRADRVYEESLSRDREDIEKLVEAMQSALNEKNIMMIEIARKKLSELLDELETGKDDHFVA
ncbi:MAG: molecular chaperone HscC [Erysipelotrichaceae bacterium]|nr:molecular chaperone HscC [Erysipelotrichaceae bacterium]MBR5755626.1 molecular chaperone HscC [Erysipelotrichaceae bacterium]